MAQDGIILTEAQVQVLKKKKLDDEVTGEIETGPSRFFGGLFVQMLGG